MSVVSVASCLTVFVMHKMTSKIQNFALDVQRKTMELQSEKQLTDKLLFEMIPRYKIIVIQHSTDLIPVHVIHN